MDVKSIPPSGGRIIRFPTRRASCCSCGVTFAPTEPWHAHCASCCSCGVTFAPTEPWHAHCANCYRWARIGRLVAVTGKLLREVRG